jgi:zinc transport system substrate-binding protein
MRRFGYIASFIPAGRPALLDVTGPCSRHCEAAGRSNPEAAHSCLGLLRSARNDESAQRKLLLNVCGTAIAALALLLVPCAGALAGPRVVATIKPIHSLAAAIMEGVAEPKLLLDGAASPHSYALRPSDATALNGADAIILVSKNLEVFLGKAIASLPDKARVIELEQTPGLRLLPVRGGGLHEDHGDGEEDEEHEGHHHGGNYDVHFWLDPLNAIAIARHLQHELSAIDPDHADQYRANARKLEEALGALDAELKAQLAGLKDKQFIVFHDVTQYFETRYGLSGAGSITLSPERAPGAKRLAEVRAKIEQTAAICVFSEPEFPPKLVQTLTQGTRARRGVLDEVGAAIPAGRDQYFALMRSDAANLAGCLKP